MMMFTKIQVIKMLRDNIPGMGLRDAKAIVDSYEIGSFEDRMARVMGEEIREELRSWAKLYVATEKGNTSLLMGDEYEYEYEYDEPPCNCEGCQQARGYLEVGD